MSNPRMVIFDLDNTLAEAFRPMSDAMRERFVQLLESVPLSIMTAASLERIEQDVLAYLPKDTDLARLSLFTANGAQAYFYKEGEWRAQYRYGFTEADRADIRVALEQCARETGVLENVKQYGPQFVDYEGYIAFTALGLGAPTEERKAWDPDASKRNRLRTALQAKLPMFDVYIGGATSVDITPKEINKAFAVRWLSAHTGIPCSEMFYVGDALYEGGNDRVVIPTGVRTRQVAGPAETLTVLDELLQS